MSEMPQQGKQISLPQYVADCWLAGMTRDELEVMCKQWGLGFAAVALARHTYETLAREYERLNTVAGR